ncbi:uncharacterized protein LOC114286328 isoform X2 [Camellia sinensis]|uniref:uncharacterized protein LOC114286328 isoform X2 n=1 Tax=Camellia sinensis TaxID=4442 RepID=UPI001036B1C4|nr:uncharacterized protein LOC114286328 isoform X2 [Camellia sinensis]
MLRPRFFWIHVDKNAIPNVALLGELGVPQSCISLFDPSKVTFVDAICVLFGMSKSAWERKVEVYKRWGLSDDDIHLAFKKFPKCMILSEKKITSGMDFLVNEIGFEPITIARTPKTLGYSLEKRIIPRCSVIRVLSLNGLIKKEKGLSAIISTSEERLLDAFVTKHQDQVPQLLNVYQKKTDVPELGIGNEGIEDGERIKKTVIHGEGSMVSTGGGVLSRCSDKPVYWSSLFILPKKIIRAIETLFRSFFWSGCEFRTHGAKVSWENICYPKNEGGLGFKSLEIWNKATIAKHIWFLFSGGEQSMWCQ